MLILLFSLGSKSYCFASKPMTIQIQHVETIRKSFLMELMAIFLKKFALATVINLRTTCSTKQPFFLHFFGFCGTIVKYPYTLVFYPEDVRLNFHNSANVSQKFDFVIGKSWLAVVSSLVYYLDYWSSGNWKKRKKLSEFSNWPASPIDSKENLSRIEVLLIMHALRKKANAFTSQYLDRWASKNKFTRAMEIKKSVGIIWKSWDSINLKSSLAFQVLVKQHNTFPVLKHFNSFSLFDKGALFNRKFFSKYHVLKNMSINYMRLMNVLSR